MYFDKCASFLTEPMPGKDISLHLFACQTQLKPFHGKPSILCFKLCSLASKSDEKIVELKALLWCINAGVLHWGCENKVQQAYRCNGDTGSSRRLLCTFVLPDIFGVTWLYHYTSESCSGSQNYSNTVMSLPSAQLWEEDSLGQTNLTWQIYV